MSNDARPLWRKLAGHYLREQRIDQGRILTEVAATAGVSPQYLSELERGRKEPSSEVLGAVTGALGLGLLDLTTGVADQLREPTRETAAVPRAQLMLAA
jgi:transcriptional regulator with XRE-family HTH domain